jgi:hypothetical protein
VGHGNDNRGVLLGARVAVEDGELPFVEASSPPRRAATPVLARDGHMFPLDLRRERHVYDWRRCRRRSMPTKQSRPRRARRRRPCTS